MRIRTQCRSCGLPFQAELEPDTEELPCPGCGATRPVRGEGWTEGPPGRVDRCPLCGSQHFYRQRDIHRGWGCLLVAIGAVLVPWTYGLSLFLLSGVDWLLYRWLRTSVVCYRCDTVYRDADPLPSQGEFDLLKHDVLKYGKALTHLEGPRPPLPEEQAAEERDEGGAAAKRPQADS